MGFDITTKGQRKGRTIFMSCQAKTQPAGHLCFQDDYAMLMSKANFNRTLEYETPRHSGIIMILLFLNIPTLIKIQVGKCGAQTSWTLMLSHKWRWGKSPVSRFRRVL